jgi:2-polyprenyl-6-methoxyphenol hydroxylase-like FAD-dependent oxidoreductase
MALQRAGIDPEIFEAYEQAADGVGSFLNIASNGLDALRVLGAHEAVMAAGIPTPRMVMWSGTGKRLGQVENGLRLDDGTVSHTIQRPDLYSILQGEATRRGIPIAFGRRLVDIQETADAVTAVFADGSTARGDILIAADGVRSATRRLIDPAAPDPRYTGLLSMGGIVSDPAFTGDPGSYNMVFGKKAFFGYTVADDGRTWWFANLPTPAEPSRPELAGTDWKQVLVEAVSHDNNTSADIIRAGMVDLVLPVFDLPPVPTWRRGRVLLTGDAAHATSPSSGQGASLAIEDGLFLAQCLRDLPDHTVAFARFEHLRRARTERVVAFSRRISNTKTAGPIGRIIRDLMMPIFLRKAANPDSLAWLYRYHIDWQARVNA